MSEADAVFPVKESEVESSSSVWRRLSLSRGGVWLACLPSLVMFVLFYSLAVHMHQVMGKWPYIGTNEFPPALLLHAHVAFWTFTPLIWFGILVFPIWFGACCLSFRFFRFTSYLAIWATTFGLFWLAMSCAPKGFLNWWWD